MGNRLCTVWGGVVALLVLSGPLWAHHAVTGMYDREKPVTMKGTVTRYRFVNPHTQVYFDVKDENGNVTNWYVETGSSQRMYRAGMKRDSLKPGDEITVTGHLNKDPSRKNMRLLKLVLPSGLTIDEGD